VAVFLLNTMYCTFSVGMKLESFRRLQCFVMEIFTTAPNFISKFCRILITDYTIEYLFVKLLLLQVCRLMLNLQLCQWKNSSRYNNEENGCTKAGVIATESRQHSQRLHSRTC